MSFDRIKRVGGDRTDGNAVNDNVLDVPAGIWCHPERHFSADRDSHVSVRGDRSLGTCVGDDGDGRIPHSDY